MDACCVSCGSHNLVDDVHEGHALVVCSDCGHVAAETAQANLTLNYGDVLTDDGPSGVLVQAHDAGGLAGSAGAAGYFKGASAEYRWRDLARTTADQLSLSRQHRDLLVDLVGLVRDQSHLNRFGWEPLLAACAYVVVRQQELPFTLRDVAVATNVHVHKIAHCMKHVLRASSIQLPPNNLRALITRHLSTVLASIPATTTARPAPTRTPAAAPNRPTATAAAHPVTLTALQLLDVLQAANALAGLSPLSVMAAVIRLAVEANVPAAKQQRWLMAHVYAALNMPCPRSANVVQSLKASLLTLAPLLPHLPRNDPLALVRHLPDVLPLTTLLSSLPASQSAASAQPPGNPPPIAALPADRQSSAIITPRPHDLPALLPAPPGWRPTPGSVVAAACAAQHEGDAAAPEAPEAAAVSGAAALDLVLPGGQAADVQRQPAALSPVLKAEQDSRQQFEDADELEQQQQQQEQPQPREPQQQEDEVAEPVPQLQEQKLRPLRQQRQRQRRQQQQQQQEEEEAAGGDEAPGPCCAAVPSSMASTGQHTRRTGGKRLRTLPATDNAGASSSSSSSACAGVAVEPAAPCAPGEAGGRVGLGCSSGARVLNELPCRAANPVVPLAGGGPGKPATRATGKAARSAAGGTGGVEESAQAAGVKPKPSPEQVKRKQRRAG